MDADTDATAEWLYDAVIRFLQVRRRRQRRPPHEKTSSTRPPAGSFYDVWTFLFPGGATRG